MDTDRLQEIDRKIKRYEGIDELLNYGLHGTDEDAVNGEETDGDMPKNLKEDEK